MIDKKLTDEQMMTIDEAIEHCYEVAKKMCNACGQEHLQLAKWLEELKESRTLINRLKADTFERRNVRIKNQREELRKMNETVKRLKTDIEYLKRQIVTLKLEKDNLIKTYVECQKAVLEDFVERFKAAYECFDENSEIIYYQNLMKAVDDVLKEIVGEANV